MGLLLIVAILAVTAYVYRPVAGYDYVSVDDPVYVADNPFLLPGPTWAGAAEALASTYGHFWHPLTLLSLMLDVALFGKTPGVFHVTNLLLHLASTLALFLALVRMTGARGRSAFVAALFALHPLHVESVAWVAERKDVLSTFFWMLTLWAWAGYAGKGRRTWYWVALASFALGLAAKPMLVTLPVVLLLLDVWPFRRLGLSRGPSAQGFSPVGQLVLEKVPFFVLAGAAGVVAIAAQGAAVASLEVIPAGTRLATALAGAGTYLVKMIWPVGLTVFYPMPATPPVGAALASFLVLGGATATSVWLLKRAPYVAVGWFWYLVTLAPVSGIVQVGSHSMADRYTYVPLTGVFILAAWGAWELAGSVRVRQWALRVAALAAVLALSVAARAQVTTWRDSAALWQHALAVTPDSYYALHGMGSLLREQGKAEEAVGYLRESIRMNPRFPDSHNNLGMALEALGRTSEAAAEYMEALRIEPGMSSAHNNLGVVLLKAGRPEEAVPHLREALKESVDPPTSHFNLAEALAEGGHYPEAQAEYLAALRQRPGYADAHAHLGFVLASQGRGEEAVAEYREALRLAPQRAETHSNLGAALAGLGRQVEAVAEFEDALRLDPGQVLAHVNLGFALASQGRAAEAIPHFTEAIRRQPNLEPAHLYLGWALGATGRPAEAAEQFREVLRINPNNVDARRGLENLAGRTPSPGR